MSTLIYETNATAPDSSHDLPVAALFASASVPMLVVDLASGRIVEANRAAALLLCVRRADLLGVSWLAAFSLSSAQLLADSCAVALESASAPLIEIDSATGRTGLTARLSMFRVAAESYLLVHLSAGTVAEPADDCEMSALLDALSRTQDCLVVTDCGLRIEYGNRAFQELVRVDTHEQIQDRPLAQWIDLTEANLAQLGDGMAQRQAATMFSTHVHVGPMSVRKAEVTAIAVPDDREPRWGFAIRVVFP
jgi:PAS domain-containing protein